MTFQTLTYIHNLLQEKIKSEERTYKQSLQTTHDIFLEWDKVSKTENPELYHKYRVEYFRSEKERDKCGERCFEARNALEDFLSQFWTEKE